jgi:alpha/beta hydrolase fold
VFSHGWPLSADDWDAQMLFFAGEGFRVIAHDRRGHGRSTQTDGGHDMDHYADDLAKLVDALDLKDAVHVGHSTRGRRSCALHGAPRFEACRQSRAHRSRPCADVEDGLQRRGVCPGNCSMIFAARVLTTARSFSKISRCRSTVTTAPEPKFQKACEICFWLRG